MESANDDLCSLLASVERDPMVDRPFTWPSTGNVLTIRQALRYLGAAGLLRQPGKEGVTGLTREGVEFLRSRDSVFLMSVLHSNVRYFGEALSVLREAMTHAELNRVAGQRYALKWSTLDQVRRRTTWLRSAGMVELWKGTHKVVITERGRDLCDRLVLARAEDIPGIRPPLNQSAELEKPGPRLSEVTEGLGQNELMVRSPCIGYIAGGTSVEAVKRLMNLLAPECERSRFISLCVEQLGVKKSSAEQSLHTLRSLGLVEQTGPDTFAPTGVGTEWLSRDHPVDLVRIMHARVALMGEVLLGARDITDTADLHAWLCRSYPGCSIRRPDLARRVSLLHEVGLVERIGWGAHRVTPLGDAFLRTIPLQKPQKDLLSAEAVAEPGGTRPARADASAELRDQANELMAASTVGSDHERFERAVEAAFRALGLETRRGAVNGDTDVVLDFWLSPTDRRRVIVEAKTASSGQVSEHQVGFDAIEGHARTNGADRIVLVGPGFGARLSRWANEKGIPVVTAKEIASWLTRSTTVRLDPHGLWRALFQGRTERDRSTEPAEDVWTAAERELEAAHRVSRVLWESGNDEKEIDFCDGALTVRDVWRTCKENSPLPLDRVEIQRVLDFLSGPLVGGAQRVSGDQYAAMVSPQFISGKLRALADAIEADSPPGSRPVPAGPSATSVGRPDAPRDSAQAPPLPAQVREWAKAAGCQVRDSGRLPKNLVAEYLAADPSQEKGRP
ncbi:restriction endonuclease [Streptantibioticus parmotrematis]|uniref:Lsr2 family DNA-binding protein n=1 Tax=Streptantibioticus parmotrematis TaxID=2873249 RepID=UPI0033D038DE